MNKKLGLFLLPALLLLLVAGAQAATAPAKKPATTPKVVTAAAKVAKPLNTAESRAVVAKALKFVSDILVDPGTKVKIEATKKDGNFFFLTITLGEGANSQKVEAVMTKNGKYFFPQVMDVDKLVANKKAANKAAVAAPITNTPKSDKPVVELFVMSYCPYGTQIEKGIIPVVEALGTSIDFKLKFVSYTMHGDKENTENTTQYCLDKEQGDKFWPYLKCFLKAGDSTTCLTETGVDKTKLEACVAAANQQFNLKGTNYSIYQEDNKKYGVQGSPTLVVNGTEVSSGRSPKALADTICQAFTAGKQPTACQGSFDSATPAPGFGGTASASNADPASCH